jgi:hypothetical protein
MPAPLSLRHKGFRVFEKPRVGVYAPVNVQHTAYSLAPE